MVLKRKNKIEKFFDSDSNFETVCWILLIICLSLSLIL